MHKWGNPPFMPQSLKSQMKQKSNTYDCYENNLVLLLLAVLTAFFFCQF